MKGNIINQRGWGGYVLKQKIKALKVSIKEWNKNHYGDTFSKFNKIEADLNKMEEESDDRLLSQQELEVRRQLQQQLWEAAQAHESLLTQKARAKWIKQGDCNTRFFHLLINSRRNNCLKGVLIDGVWREEPIIVKEEVRNFFMQRFQEADHARPRLDGIHFQSIDFQQNQMLVERFNEEEVRMIGC